MLQVDVWALGISAVEMAEVTPPRWSVHPMRVIFMISRDPPPRLTDRDKWSLTFHDFVAQCLQKVCSQSLDWRTQMPTHQQTLSNANVMQLASRHCQALISCIWQADTVRC